MKKKLKFTLLMMAAMIAVFVLAGYFYINDYYTATYTLDEYRDRYQELGIDEFENYIRIQSEESSDKGIIFYPGGKVEYTAYVPLMTHLAKEGYTTYIVEMPFNLAVFGVNKAEKVIKDNPEIREWYIGGHSLGGAMASSYVSKNPEKFEGIFFLGSYPSSNLSSTDMKFVSIYGDKDLVVNNEKILTTMEYAPVDKYYYKIMGANHSGYGDYGHQKGDGEPTLTSEEQIQETVRVLVQQFN